jgi:hypothetical protein
MAGVHGQVIGHLVRRGVSAAHEHFTGASDQYVAQLQHDAALYDTKADGDASWEVRSYEMIPVIITGFITLFIIAAVRTSRPQANKGTPELTELSRIDPLLHRRSHGRPYHD